MDLLEAREQKYGDSIKSRHPWEEARVNVLKKIILKHTPIQKGNVVLDIGCGDTFVVEKIAIDYPEAVFYAIDTAFTIDLIKKYRDNLKVKNVYLFSSLDDFVKMSDEKVSLVILTDVIEHIENDKKFISELLQKNFIKNNTHFIITVPAFQSLFCSHDIFLGHYRRYTNKLLMNNLSSAGLITISAGYFFFCLLPIRVLLVLKEKIIGFEVKKISTGLAKWNGSSVVSLLFMNLLILDARFSFFFKKIKINLPGLSNYAVCRKYV